MGKYVTMTFGDFEDIYTHFGRLPLFSLWAEESEE